MPSPRTRARTAPRPSSARPRRRLTPTSFKPTSGALTINQIYRRSAPGVVVVTATTTTSSSSQQNPFGFGAPQQQQAQSLGSGFVIDTEGHILTNAHVVVGASKVQIGFSGGATYDAKVIGLDKSTDVAVLQGVNVPSSALKPLAIGNSDNVQVGDSVVAIGNPLGESRTVTSGIVSALDRTISSLQANTDIYGAIQTDAAINHGNSGGPLINADGQVIGINSQILSDNPQNPESGNIGIGFAVPINTAKRVAEQIISSGKATHTYIGILGEPLTPSIAKALNLPVSYGVLVADVQSGSPAEKAGIKGGTTQATISGVTYKLGGDIITKIDGQKVDQFSVLSDAIASKKPGDQVTLEVVRGGKTMTVTVTLASH